MILWKRQICVMLAVLLVTSLLPVFNNPALANTYLEIKYWVIGENQPVTPSQITDQNVTVEVEFSDMSESDISKLYYEITNVNTGIKKDVRDNIAVKTGTRSVEFRNVELTEGLNKIVIRSEVVSIPASFPAWINFTPVATVSNLTIDQRTFIDKIIVPERNPLAGQTTVYAEGLAPNATEIIASSTLEPAGKQAGFFFPQTGDLSIALGDGPNVDLRLRPGDNDFSLAVGNPLKGYHTTRHFYYNNGQSFLYETRISSAAAGSNLSVANDSYLFRQPTVSTTTSAGSSAIDVATNIKINRDTNGAQTHQAVEFSLNGGSNVYRISLTALAAGSYTYTVQYPAVLGLPNYTGTATVEAKPDYFLLTGVRLPNLHVDTTQPEQLLDVKFEAMVGSTEQSQNFMFSYVNQQEPYIDSVRLSETDRLLYSGIEVTISQEAVSMYVQAEQGADGVNVYMEESSQGGVGTGVLRHLVKSSTKVIESVSNFTATPAATSATLSWTAPTGGSGPYTYEVYYREGGDSGRDVSGAVKIAPASSGSSIGGLQANTEYTFAVYAVDATGRYSPVRKLTLTTGGTVTKPAPAQPAVYYHVNLNKNHLPEGRSILVFKAYKNVGGTEQEYAGFKRYLVNYNPSPYVYLTNLYSGQVISSINNQPEGKSGNITFAGPVLQINPVNIPQSQWGDIRIKLNESYDKVRPSTSTFPAGYGSSFHADQGGTYQGDAYYVDNVFREFRVFFGLPQAHSKRQNWALRNGLNEIVIEVYPQGTLTANAEVPSGVRPVTTFKYELYYFTSELPQAASLDLYAPFTQDRQFTRIEGDVPRYYTQEKQLQFQAKVVNAKRVEVIFNYVSEDGKAHVARAISEFNAGAFGPWMMTDSGTAFTHAGALLQPPAVDAVSTTANNATATITSQLLELSGTGSYVVEVITQNDAGIYSSPRMLYVDREAANFIVHYPTIDPDTKVGVVNGNFTKLYIEAEKVDKIIYAKNKEITNKTQILIDGQPQQVFIFEVHGLKKGNNTIKFTLVRGKQQQEGQITLVNADTLVPGAQFKESISKRNIRAFNRAIELSFPNGTILRKIDERAPDQALSPTRDILIGVADPVDGRVNKVLHPLSTLENSKFFDATNLESRSRAYSYLREETGRFRRISPMFWVDGGVIGSTPSEVLYGSGLDPYEKGKEFYLKSTDRANQFIPSQPGTLTLKYDPNMVESSWRYITVFHYGYVENYLGEKRYKWTRVGGTVDTKNNTITVPLSEFGYYTVMYMDRSYDDVIEHWGKDYMDTLYSKGIMESKSSNRFETNEPISRGEFATLLVKVFQLPLNYEGTGTFEDVPVYDPFSNGLYEYKYIETAARAGIVRGVLGRRFTPAMNISRQDAAVLIARAANLKLNTNSTKVQQDLQKRFTDSLDIQDYTKASVLAVAGSGLITGKENITILGPDGTYRFDPRANMTRAEAAVVIMRVMLQQKRIPYL